jgi:hypothetical protein
MTSRRSHPRCVVCPLHFHTVLLYGMLVDTVSFGVSLKTRIRRVCVLCFMIFCLVQIATTEASMHILVWREPMCYRFFSYALS